MRFVLPVLPIALMYGAHGLRCFQLGAPSFGPPAKQKSILNWIVKALVLSNGIAAIYLSRWHQRAPLDVIDYLAHEIEIRTFM